MTHQQQQQQQQERQCCVTRSSWVCLLLLLLLHKRRSLLLCRHSTLSLSRSCNTRRPLISLSSLVSRLSSPVVMSEAEGQQPVAPVAAAELAEGVAGLKHVPPPEEKVVLPSAQDIEAEKREEALHASIETFDASALKHQETREKLVLPSKEDIEAEKRLSTSEA